MRSIAFIPARSGSKRIPEKNIKILFGHPLLAYSISAALECGMFDTVICSTDSEHYADIARYYGAEVPLLRPASSSGDKSPDIDWVFWILKELQNQGREFDLYCILRPTNPFRMPKTISIALEMFINDPKADSLRAVERCRQHPGKMWVKRNDRALPLLPFEIEGTPWHSSQYAALPEIFVQNASLEIAWTRVPMTQHTISGEVVIPFVMDNYEGFDINYPIDWVIAEYLVNHEGVLLPNVKNRPFSSTCLEVRHG